MHSPCNNEEDHKILKLKPHIVIDIHCSICNRYVPIKKVVHNDKTYASLKCDKCKGARESWISFDDLMFGFHCSE